MMSPIFGIEMQSLKTRHLVCSFVEKIEGCHTNAIGLSLPLLRQMLRDLGYDVADFWS